MTGLWLSVRVASCWTWQSGKESRVRVEPGFAYPRLAGSGVAGGMGQTVKPPGTTLTQEKEMFWILHIAAVFVFPLALFFTIPLHIISNKKA